jgi:hypothetical protein
LEAQHLRDIRKAEIFLIITKVMLHPVQAAQADISTDTEGQMVVRDIV